MILNSIFMSNCVIVLFQIAVMATSWKMAPVSREFPFVSSLSLLIQLLLKFKDHMLTPNYVATSQMHVWIWRIQLWKL